MAEKQLCIDCEHIHAIFKNTLDAEYFCYKYKKKIGNPLNYNFFCDKKEE